MLSKAKKTNTGAVAVEATSTDGDLVGVGIGSLRVLISKDGKFWYAQGLEIDYGCQGDTIEQAKENFEEGLLANIDLQLHLNGTIDDLLTFAPSDVLREAAKDTRSIQALSQISFHDLRNEMPAAWPFDHIDFYTKDPEELAA